MRVATLLPSATEIVYALGVEPVAVSHECDYPPGADEKPAITKTAVDSDGSSASINEAVDRVLRTEGGVYDIDLEVLETTRPDLAITQGLCDVCAVDEVTVERAIEHLDRDVEVLTTDPHRFEDLYADIHRIAAAVDRTSAGDRLIHRLRNRVESLTRNDVDARRRVVVVEWMDPPMVAGHWIPELVRIAGGEYGLADPGDRSRPRAWSEIRAYDPEILIVSPCGFSVEQTRRHLDELRGRPGWGELTASRAGRVFLVDGNHLVNRPGPRLVETLAAFVDILGSEPGTYSPDEFVSHVRDRGDADRRQVRNSHDRHEIDGAGVGIDDRDRSILDRDGGV